MAALGIGAFFFALILVIVIHEAAHFAVARAFGIKVTEFFVGFGPKLWSRMRGETEVGIKAIPAGGYVKIAGMNPYETVAPEDLPRTFGAKPIWQRALVILAGPATHFVLAFLCFAVWLGFVGQPVAKGVVIVRGQADAARRASRRPRRPGCEPGDDVVAVDGLHDPSADQLVAFTTAHAGEPVTFTIERDGRTFEAVMVPVAVPGERRADRQDRRRGAASPDRPRHRGPDRFGHRRRRPGRRAGRPDGAGGRADLRAGGDRSPVRPGLHRRGPPAERSRERGGGGAARGQPRVRGPVRRPAVPVRRRERVRRPAEPAPAAAVRRRAPAVLAIEKVRGRPVDMRKVVPVSAAVAAFFIVFTVAVVYVDLVKPPV